MSEETKALDGGEVVESHTGLGLVGLVAQEVLGWERREKDGAWIPECWNDSDLPLPEYADSFDDASEVLDRMSDKGWDWRIQRFQGGNVYVEFNAPGRFGCSAQAQTVPLAICKAALRTVRHQDKHSW